MKGEITRNDVCVAVFSNITALSLPALISVLRDRAHLKANLLPRTLFKADIGVQILETWADYLTSDDVTDESRRGSLALEVDRNRSERKLVRRRTDSMVSAFKEAALRRDEEWDNLRN